MVSFEWSPDLCVGNETIDGEHQRYFTFLARLGATIGGTSTEIPVIDLFHRFVSAVEEDLTTEENLFHGHEYPRAIEHIGRHEEFVTKLLELDWEYAMGMNPFDADTLGYLRAWLVDHIVKEDRPFAEYLRSLTAPEYTSSH